MKLMKTPAVRELKPDEIANAVFLVQAKEIRQKRTGEPYLSLTLSDRTGEIEARMWDNVAEIMDTFERDDFIKVRGQLQIYNTRPQFIVHKLRRMADVEVEFADFFPASARNADEMWAELRAIVSAVPNPHLRALLEAFLDDPDISARFRVAPAAKSIHHAFRAGLLEHVLSLLGLARPIAAHYNAANCNAVDWSLMVAGIVLHDIGKIYELTYERGFAYSTEGQLIGHIAIAMRMVSDKLRAFPEFPGNLRTLLEHMILSHHGKLEFGSPKVPQFPEALLLHYLDDMDSKMECMRATAEKGALAEGLFTAWSSPLERVVLRKERYLNGSAPPPTTSPVTPAAASTATPAAGATPVGLSQAATQGTTQKDGSVFGDKLRAALVVEVQPGAERILENG
jgi:3'-5' exoribonuclease